LLLHHLPFTRFSSSPSLSFFRIIMTFSAEFRCYIGSQILSPWPTALAGLLPSWPTALGHNAVPHDAMFLTEFFYLICHDFRKINGRIKIFDKCTSGVVSRDGRLLPPYPTALSPCCRGARRQESGSCARAGSAAPGPCRRAAQRQVRTAMPHGGRVFFWVFKTLLTF
jgi:hypothetical protein